MTRKAYSEVTGKDERSTIREGIADCDLYAMFGCISVKGGKLSLILDNEGNIKGKEDNAMEPGKASPGELLESAFRRKGAALTPFDEKTERESRVERMAAMHATRVANGFDDSSMDIPADVSVFDAIDDEA